MNNELAMTEDWSIITSLLPEGWRDKAKELGAIKRFRRFSDEDDLLRALLIHIVEGCSGRETAVRIQEAGIAEISDVAFLQRLSKAGEWFRWMAEMLMKKCVNGHSDTIESSGLRIRIVDATCLKGPGRKSLHRIHYAVELPSLLCDEIKITEQKTGESFTNFSIQPGDLLIGDRGYAHPRGIASVIKNGGHVLVRTNLKLPFREEDGTKTSLITKLEALEEGMKGDWDQWIYYEEMKIKGRVCAIKKDPDSCAKARKKALVEHRKSCGNKGRIMSETLKAADYIFVFTTLDRTFTADQILDLYKGRWQVELVFKRLKSIIKVGNLHNKNLNTARAWLHGKLLIAFLTETIIQTAKSFPPSGVVPPCPIFRQSQLVEGNIVRPIMCETCNSTPLQALLVHNVLGHHRT